MKTNNTKKIVITTLVFAMMTMMVLPLGGQAKQYDLRSGEIEHRDSRNMSQLVIHAPSSVLEGEMFLVKVTDESGNLVCGAMVTFWNHTYLAPNRSVWLTAPLITETLVTTIRATAWEYYPAETNITIVNIMGQLFIDAPSSVHEGMMFLVRVTDENGALVSGAWVTFWNETYDLPSGQIWLLAPQVNHTIVTTIKAQAFEYFPAETTITIIDTEIIPGDMDGDGNVTFTDINLFVYALTHTEAQFKAEYPQGQYWAADVNQDGSVDFGDINPFVALLSSS